MKRLTLLAMLLISLADFSFAADQSGKSTRPAIYNPNADGNKQIEQALQLAKAEKKHVLLQFGANWCGWCHRLHGLFKDNADIARMLKDNYVVVLIDVDRVDGKTHNAEVEERFGHPTRFGLPVLVVLDSNGKQLTTQDTGKLEEGDHHDPNKVKAFLEKWSPATAGKN